VLNSPAAVPCSERAAAPKKPEVVDRERQLTVAHHRPRLAGLLDLQTRELVGVLLHQFGEAVQDERALRRQRPSPLGARLCGCCHLGTDLAGCGVGDRLDRETGCGVDRVRNIAPTSPRSDPVTQGRASEGFAMTTSRTFVFMPESAYGPTNNCVGIANVLRERGHRVVFAAERSWEGKLEALGFEEDLVDLAPHPNPIPRCRTRRRPVLDRLHPRHRTGVPQATIEQLSSFIQPTWQALIDGAKYCEPQLREIIERARPDVIVEDNVVGFPALVTAGAPFVRIMSCNPLEVGGADVPPVFSGYPVATAPAGTNSAASTSAPIARCGRTTTSGSGRAAHPGSPTCISSTPANTSTSISIPRRSTTPTCGRWTAHGTARLVGAHHRRAVRAAEQLHGRDGRDGERALIYLSLGSLGSADVDLMRRLVDVLSRTRHRFIVSKGPQAALYELADNMWGAQSVPQTNVIPLVDLVITHAGNNTTTESFHFGKPMVALPLFWDQYDNANGSTRPGSVSVSTPIDSPTRKCTARSSGCSATPPVGAVRRSSARPSGHAPALGSADLLEQTRLVKRADVDRYRNDMRGTI
jgi:UDP:flavonoid glycosyltransferase YjiC (YdhE family)